MEFKYKIRLNDRYIIDDKMGLIDNMEHFNSVIKNETDINYIYPIRDVLNNHNLSSDEKIKEIQLLQDELFEIRNDHWKWGQAILDHYLP